VRVCVHVCVCLELAYRVADRYHVDDRYRCVVLETEVHSVQTKT